MQGIRIYEMPACKMVSSGKGMFGEGNFPLFEEWFSSQKRSLFPKDFLYWAGDGFVWLYMYEEYPHSGKAVITKSEWQSPLPACLILLCRPFSQDKRKNTVFPQPSLRIR